MSRNKWAAIDSAARLMDTRAIQTKKIGSKDTFEALDLQVGQRVLLLREQVLERLRDAIVQGVYTPGTRLKERELCERIGVSRTSVREALRQLETEGLVHIAPRRGPVVTTIAPRQAEEIYEFRKIIEAYAARNFIDRASPKQRQDLRGHLTHFVKAARKNDMPTMINSMSCFYDTLFEGFGNTIVHTVSRQLMARISYLRSTSMSEQGRPNVSIQEMTAIVDAIESKNYTATERAILNHLQNASSAALRQLTSLSGKERAGVKEGVGRRAKKAR